MVCYSTIKNNEFMKFLGKWLELERVILSEVTQSKEQAWNALIDKWILTQMLRMNKIQLTDHKKLKKE